MRILYALAFLLAASSASANDMNADTWRKYLESDRNYEEDFRSFALHYINGVTSGISWANLIATKNNNPIYCRADSSFSLSEELILSIVDEQYERKGEIFSQVPISVVIVQGLIERYPCN